MSNFSRFPIPFKITSPIFTQEIEIEIVAVFKFQPRVKGDRESEEIKADLIIDRIEPSSLVPCDMEITLADHYNSCANLDELKESIKKDG
jgi:hypothetical protein